jgi:hypothetical protein
LALENAVRQRIFKRGAREGFFFLAAALIAQDKLQEGNA